VTAADSPTSSLLERLRVVDAMHPGVISCPPEASLQTVARMMADYGVHAILVHGHGHGDGTDADGWGVISDWQLLQAAAVGDVRSVRAIDIAVSPVVGIATAEPLSEALRLMAETGSSHVLAVERHSRRPIGVVSTLDVVRAVADLADR
jgi:CBS domain-containing protein